MSGPDLREEALRLLAGGGRTLDIA